MFTEASKRQCSKCREWKLQVDFYRYGKKTISYCKSCWNSYMMQKYSKEQRAEWERDRNHRIQEEAGCYLKVRNFYPGYRFLKALQEL